MKGSRNCSRCRPSKEEPLINQRQESRSRNVFSIAGASQNKKLAVARLLAKLAAIEEAKKNNQTYEIWMNHNLLQRGNPVKKFKGDL